jgi:hypothetical protein
MSIKVYSKRRALIAKINRKNWWHVPPSDPKAYEKRGKFYSSTFQESMFWGRPLDAPQRVEVKNPVVGDELEVWRVLFGAPLKVPDLNSPRLLQWRWKVDSQMKRAALRKGYDAIAIMSPSGFRKFKEGRLPSSVELNVLNPTGA